MKKKQAKIGDVVEVEVVGMQDYGAFVYLIEPDFSNDSVEKNSKVKKGLIHISEIHSGFVKNVHDVVKIGQRLTAQIIDIDEFNGKISLSLRSLEENPQVHHFYRKKHFTDPRNKIGFRSLKRELDHWVQEGEDYLDKKR